VNAEAVIAALPDAALLTDKFGTITAANAAASAVLQGEVRGLSLKAMIRNPAFAHALEQIAVDGQPISVDVEFRSRPPRLLSAHLARVGEDQDLVVLLRDITREQAVEKMR
jgi:PAS domain-containing protein